MIYILLVSFAPCLETLLVIVYLVAIDGIPWGNFEGAVDYIQPAPHSQSRKEDNDIGGAEKLGRLILIITMLRGKNFWLKMERKVMPSIYI